MKIRTLGHSPKKLPQAYPQLLWISPNEAGTLKPALAAIGARRYIARPALLKRDPPMQADIHPAYSPIKVTCSCGNEFATRSTLGEDLAVEVCSSCHPFYTGKQKIVDTAGRVDKFRKKYGIPA